MRTHNRVFLIAFTQQSHQLVPEAIQSGTGKQCLVGLPLPISQKLAAGSQQLFTV